MQSLAVGGIVQVERDAALARVEMGKEDALLDPNTPATSVERSRTRVPSSIQTICVPRLSQ